jgi:beta-lactamase superfamily II metal-dependent hydrolase
MRNRVLQRLLLVCLFAARLALSQEIGEPLSSWTPGTLEIHQIHTGRGNAAFFLFPDGTTMLFDAGSVPDRKGLEIGPQRPNSSRPPAEWITRYIEQFSPRRPATLDYAVVSHYHDDHIAALPRVAEQIPIATLIDRGEEPPPPSFPVVRSYFDFRRAFRGSVESLRVGQSDQIVLRRSPSSSKDFEVRNVAGNGFVWTGTGSEARSPFPSNWRALPKADQPNENDFSLALLIRYGKFRYYTGGDLAGVVLDEGPSWRDLETPIAKAIGRVDVAVLNHHGWLDTTNPFFLQTLQPSVVVIPAWHATHPDHSVLRRLRSPKWKPAPPDLFITTLLDAPRAVFSYLGESLRSTEGHIVIRVPAGGERFEVLILDSTREVPNLKARFGPYPTGGAPPRQ